MAAFMKVLTLTFLVILCINHTEAGWNTCFATWSRCSRWSIWFTGIAWLNCNDRCRQLGKSGGECKESPSKCPLASKAYQCQCN